MPLTLTAMAAFCAEAAAQGAFPPLPQQQQQSSNAAASPFPPQPGAAAPAASSPFPPVNGAAAAPVQRSAGPSPFTQGGAAPLGGGLAAGSFGGGGPGGGDAAGQQDCMEKFAPLRADAEKRAQAVKAASARKASAQEACGLIKNYVSAEAKLVNYVTTKQTACGIPAEVPKQLKANHARSQQMMKGVCQAAAGGGGGGPAPAPSLSEALGASSAAPEIRSARSGRGSTFDTINGNVLER
jgi:hypothetical protein